MGKAKYVVIGIIGLLVVFFGINGMLFVMGMQDLSIPQDQPSGNRIRLSLLVPNKSMIPIEGAIDTKVFDAITGQQIGSGFNAFKLEPGKINPVNITVDITAKTQNAVRVKMDYSFGMFGLMIPIPGAEVTMQSLG